MTSPPGPHSLVGPRGFAGTQGLVQVGDLDGDGLRDVIDLRTITRDNGRDVTAMTARVGDTGRPIWRLRLSNARCGADDITVAPMRVGPSGATGVLVLRGECSNGHKSGSIATALSGRTGRPVWHTFVPGFLDGLTDLGDALPGPASDVMGAILVERPKRSSVTPVIVDGTDGSLDRLRPVVTRRRQEYGPPLPARVFAVPDLDGDGLDNFLVCKPADDHFNWMGRTGTGALIWRRTGPTDPVVTITPAGRMGTRSANDLVVGLGESQRARHSWQILIDGTTGRTIWRRHGEDAVRVERAGRHLLPAVAIVKDFPPFTKYAGGHRVGIEIRAVGLHDHTIWTRSFVRHSAQPVDPGDAAEGLEIIDGGDVEPDGAHEIQVSDAVTSGRRGLISGLVDGRTGRLLPNVLGVPADGSFTDSPGTDSIGFDVPPKHEFTAITVEGRDGLTNHLYFRRTFRLGQFSLGLPVATRVTPRCSSVALSTDGPPGPQLDAMVSGSGHLLWKLRYAGGEMFGGKLTVGKPSTDYCSTAGRSLRPR